METEEKVKRARAARAIFRNLDLDDMDVANKIAEHYRKTLFDQRAFDARRYGRAAGIYE